MTGALNLALSDVLSWQSLGWCVVGCLAGMLLGVLLGGGPAIAALLAFTLDSNPSGAIVLLAGLYFGSQYGRSIAAILFGVPGGPSAVATTFDGHPMASHGQAGRALTVTLIALAVGCSIASVFVAIVGPHMRGIALLLGPAEYVAMMVLSLAIAVAVAGGEPHKALAMVVLGLLLAYVGTNIETGDKRLTFGLAGLEDGLGTYAVVLGLIVLPAVLRRLTAASSDPAQTTTAGPAMPQPGDIRHTMGPMLRGSLIGIVLSQLPLGALLAPFAAYKLEKTLAGEREPFGSGVLAGVAAPEAANNAAAQAALAPLLVLGFSHDAIGRMLLGTLTMFKVVPGPAFAANSPGVFWGLIAAFWMAGLIVLVMGLGLAGLWGKLLLLPRRYVLGALLLIGCALAYFARGSAIDVGVAAALAALMYGLSKRGFEPMPALIAFFLGHLLEENLRRTLLLSRGSYLTFLERPISAAFVLAALMIFGSAVWVWARPGGTARAGGA